MFMGIGPNCFSSDGTILNCHPPFLSVPTAPYSCQHRLVYLILVILVGMLWHLIVVLISIFIMMNSSSDFQGCDGHLSLSCFKVSGFVYFFI